MRRVRYFFDDPVVIDRDLRARMEAFRGRDPEQPWSWLVKGTQRVNEHDFGVITGRRFGDQSAIG